MPVHRFDRFPFARRRAASFALHAAMRAMLVGCAALPCAYAQAADAVQQQTRAYDIAAGSLATALGDFAAASGIALSFDPALAAGLQSQGLRGNYGVQSGFATLLAGSGLIAVDRGNGEFTLRRLTPEERAALEDGRVLAPVRVRATGIDNAYGPIDGYVAKRSATGTKTDTPIIEVPQSISVLTSDRIETIGATRLKDALAYTPGINPSPWGDESQYDWIYIRGFDAYSPGFYLDGLQLRNSGSWGVWQTENYGAERVEILRGPSSVLYGQNGPGGVVNVVSKRPTADPIRELQVQVGNYSRRQLAADFSGPLDSEGQWLYRVTGLVRDAELSTADLPDERTFIAPTLTWNPSDKTSLTLLSQFLRMRTGSVWSSYPAEGTLLPNPNGKIPVSTFIGESDFNRYNQDQEMVGYLFEHQFSEQLTLRQNARYGHFDVDYKTFYNQQFITVDAANPASPANYRLMGRTPFGSKEDSRSFAIDNQMQAAWRWGEWQHTLLMGLDYQRTRMDVVAYYGGVAAPIDLYDPVYGSSVTLAASPFLDMVTTLKQTGWYFQDQIKPTEHWVITLGGRYDHATIESKSRPSDSTSQQSDDEFTGRAGVVYLAPSGLAPYLSYSESFSPTTTINPLTGDPFEPETGRQYEAGIRYQPTGKKDIYSAAIFDTRRQNYVSYDAVYMPKQTGEVKVHGLEIETLLQPLERMNLTMAYTFTPKADVTASNNPVEIGRQLMAVPEHQLSVWVDYQLAMGLKFGLGARYTGSTHGSQQNAPEEIPHYTLVDALIGYDIGHWSLALNARNLADKTYVATCDGAGVSCSYGEPRKVVGTATYRW